MEQDDFFEQAIEGGSDCLGFMKIRTLVVNEPWLGGPPDSALESVTLFNSFFFYCLAFSRARMHR